MGMTDTAHVVFPMAPAPIQGEWRQTALVVGMMTLGGALRRKARGRSRAPVGSCRVLFGWALTHMFLDRDASPGRRRPYHSVMSVAFCSKGVAAVSSRLRGSEVSAWQRLWSEPLALGASFRCHAHAHRR